MSLQISRPDHSTREASRAWGLSTSIDAYGCDPSTIQSREQIVQFTHELCDLLAVKRFGETHLERVRLWGASDPHADDWSRFAEYVLRCEGVAAPSRDEVCAREQQTRGVLAKVLLTDARNRHPLGQSRVGTYDLLISGFCLDCLSQSKSVWRRCMRNVFGLLKPGGSFVVLALRGCKRYRVGGQWFSAANIQLCELKTELLSCHADAAHLEVLEHELPSHASQGYSGILLASGRTAA